MPARRPIVAARGRSCRSHLVGEHPHLDRGIRRDPDAGRARAVGDRDVGRPKLPREAERRGIRPQAARFELGGDARDLVGRRRLHPADQAPIGLRIKKSPDADGVGAQGPPLAPDAAEGAGGARRRLRRAVGRVGELRTRELVLRLTAGLAHAVGAEDLRHALEAALGIRRHARVAQHLGAVELADRRVDGRRRRERRMRVPHDRERADEIPFVQRDVAGVVDGHGPLDVAAGRRIVGDGEFEVDASRRESACLHVRDAAVEVHGSAMLGVVSDPGDRPVEQRDRPVEVASLEREQAELSVDDGLRSRRQTAQCESVATQPLRRRTVALPRRHRRERPDDARAQVAVVGALGGEGEGAPARGVASRVEVGAAATIQLRGGEGHPLSMPCSRPLRVTGFVASS